MYLTTLLKYFSFVFDFLVENIFSETKELRFSSMWGLGAEQNQRIITIIDDSIIISIYMNTKEYNLTDNEIVAKHFVWPISFDPRTNADSFIISCSWNSSPLAEWSGIPAVIQIVRKGIPHRIRNKIWALPFFLIHQTSTTCYSFHSLLLFLIKFILNFFNIIHIGSTYKVCI